MLKKNQILTAVMENHTVDGYGVCRIDGRAVFVHGALCGESWEILIMKVTASAVWAKGLRCLSASEQRIRNDCPNPCGGCATRHMAYELELTAKKARVEDCLKRIGGLDIDSSPVHPSSEIQRYRNKAVFAVGMKDEKAVFGFFRPHSHNIVPISDCLLQSERCICAAQAVIAFLNEKQLPAYDEQTGKGTVRHIFFRETRCGDAVLCIVSARGFGDLTAELTEFLCRACPDLTGIVLNINKNKGNTVLAGDYYTLWGEPNVRENLCGHSFTISPLAFLQVNVLQAESVYRKALEYAAGSLSASPAGLALELYCGAGTASLCLSDAFNRVIAAEIIPEAVENARYNAACNGVTNVEFICADAGEAADRLRTEGLKPDAVLVDPPRKGLAEQVIRDIAGMQPDRVVYISCNPATLARDVKLFADESYHLSAAEAFDMFPRTGHVECVCLLNNKNVKPKDYVEIGGDAEDC